MKPRISVITLGVDDLARAVRFYRTSPGPNNSFKPIPRHGAT